MKIEQVPTYLDILNSNDKNSVKVDNLPPAETGRQTLYSRDTHFKCQKYFHTVFTNFYSCTEKQNWDTPLFLVVSVWMLFWVNWRGTHIHWVLLRRPTSESKPALRTTTAFSFKQRRLWCHRNSSLSFNAGTTWDDALENRKQRCSSLTALQEAFFPRMSFLAPWNFRQVAK